MALNLTSFTCWPFNSPTIFGFHWSLNCASFSARLTFCMIGSGCLARLPVRRLRLLKIE
jgi:hypothetical protein